MKKLGTIPKSSGAENCWMSFRDYGVDGLLVEIGFTAFFRGQLGKRTLFLNFEVPREETTSTGEMKRRKSSFLHSDFTWFSEGE